MYRLYKYGFLVFAFSLPNFEALKYIGFFIMLMGFSGRVIWEKSITINKLSTIDWLIITILLSSVLSTLLNWPLTSGTKDLRHTACFLSTFWMLYRSEPDPKLLIQVAMALMAGTLTGLCLACYNLFLTTGASFNLGEFELSFNLISAVSRSGSFAATMLFVCIGIIIDNSNNFKRNILLFAAVFLTIISAYILIAGGRSSVLSIAIVYLFLLFQCFKNKKYIKLLIIQTLVISCTIILLLQCLSPDIGRLHHLTSTKFSFKINEMATHDQIRYDYWRVGIAQIFQKPSFFGVGPGNFKSINIKNLNFDPPLLKESIQLINGAPNHSHNWLLTTWAETGLLGFLAFLSLLICITYKLWQNRPVHLKNVVNWTWVASFSAILIACIDGFFNSSFTQENGWLTFVLMGIGINAIRKPQDSSHEKK